MSGSLRGSNPWRLEDECFSKSSSSGTAGEISIPFASKEKEFLLPMFLDLCSVVIAFVDRVGKTSLMNQYATGPSAFVIFFFRL